MENWNKYINYFLNDKYPIVYIPIARVASGSIAESLGQGRKNAKASIIRKTIGEKEWSSRFKFTFVRDPYDRFLSAMNGYAESTKMETLIPILDIVQGAMSGMPELFIPQSDYIDEKLDFIGRIEEKDDWNKLCKLIKVEIPLIKSNKTKVVYTSLNNQEKDFVKSYYKKDFTINVK